MRMIITVVIVVASIIVGTTGSKLLINFFLRRSSSPPSFSFKSSEEISNAILKLRKNPEYQKKYFNIHDAHNLCKLIIEGPWHQVKLKRLYKINPLSVSATLSGRTIIGGVIKPKITGRGLEFKVTISTNHDWSVERQILILFHEIGHVFHISNNFVNFHHSTTLKQETIAEIVQIFLTKLFIETIADSQCPSVSRQVEIFKLLSQIENDGESKRGRLIASQILIDTVPKNNHLEAIKKAMEMSNEEIGKIYNSIRPYDSGHKSSF